MEPLERLLNLVGLLLETRTPLTFEQIRETLEPYRQEKVDSAKRMFERDKDILRDYGVPLELVDTDAWGTEQGYVIPKDAYYLPEIAFTPEELAALFVAAQGIRNDTPAEEAVRKLMVGAEGGVLAGLGRWASRLGIGRSRLARHGGRRGGTGSPARAVRVPHVQGHRLGTRRRRVHGAVPLPDTGTSSGSIASEERPGRSACRASRRISPTPERGASRPKASSPPTWWRRGRGPRRGRSARRSRCHRTSRGGPRRR